MIISLKRIRYNCLANYDYDKFVVITRSRTGSNFLISLLNSHKNIQAHGEVFARLHNKKAKEKWNLIFSKKFRPVKLVGFKIFYYHPFDNDDKDVWNYIKNDNRIKIIHLRRVNKLRTHISRLIAEKNDIWLSEGKDQMTLKDKKVKVNLDKCLEDFKKIENWENQVKLDFLHHPLIEITYESLVNKQQATMKHVFNFLGTRNLKVSSKLKKLNPGKLTDLVLNYDELFNELSNSEYSYMLKD